MRPPVPLNRRGQVPRASVTIHLGYIWVRMNGFPASHLPTRSEVALYHDKSKPEIPLPITADNHHLDPIESLSIPKAYKLGEFYKPWSPSFRGESASRFWFAHVRSHEISCDSRDDGMLVFPVNLRQAMQTDINRAVDILRELRLHASFPMKAPLPQPPADKLIKSKFKCQDDMLEVYSRLMEFVLNTFGVLRWWTEVLRRLDYPVANILNHETKLYVQSLHISDLPLRGAWIDLLDCISHFDWSLAARAQLPFAYAFNKRTNEDERFIRQHPIFLAELERRLVDSGQGRDRHWIYTFDQPQQFHKDVLQALGRYDTFGNAIIPVDKLADSEMNVFSKRDANTEVVASIRFSDSWKWSRIYTDVEWENYRKYFYSEVSKTFKNGSTTISAVVDLTRPLSHRLQREERTLDAMACFFGSWDHTSAGFDEKTYSRMFVDQVFDCAPATSLSRPGDSDLRPYYPPSKVDYVTCYMFSNHEMDIMRDARDLALNNPSNGVVSLPLPFQGSAYEELARSFADLDRRTNFPTLAVGPSREYLQQPGQATRPEEPTAVVKESVRSRFILQSMGARIFNKRKAEPTPAKQRLTGTAPPTSETPAEKRARISSSATQEFPAEETFVEAPARMEGPDIAARLRAFDAAYFGNVHKMELPKLRFNHLFRLSSLRTTLEGEIILKMYAAWGQNESPPTVWDIFRAGLERGVYIGFAADMELATTLFIEKLTPDELLEHQGVCRSDWSPGRMFTSTSGRALTSDYEAARAIIRNHPHAPALCLRGGIVSFVMLRYFPELFQHAVHGLTSQAGIFNLGGSNALESPRFKKFWDEPSDALIHLLLGYREADHQGSKNSACSIFPLPGWGQPMGRSAQPYWVESFWEKSFIEGISYWADLLDKGEGVALTRSQWVGIFRNKTRRSTFPLKPLQDEMTALVNDKDFGGSWHMRMIENIEADVEAAAERQILVREDGTASDVF
ncbi:hypothetical protein CYLTODRAFT_420104 [Cylindrobasidium torrendii FP15055 ss-10]|uniref:Uncharacterized protein n=1 Tax=Cylindrobasidium torrendii FP15055 ss-10 TaxID=1314674 RepID=A0A0D7BIS6_9AGAR|nr:hypothetical protein CYLTODRAFT_420104 [Cylindrobasidium torrendii FP15055 ss-10]